MKAFVSLISLVILVAIFWWALRTIGSGIDEEKNKYRVEIGKTIIVGKDTLKVLDYSTLQENFTLSNGATVSYEFVKKNQNHKTTYQ